MPPVQSSDAAESPQPVPDEVQTEVQTEVETTVATVDFETWSYSLRRGLYRTLIAGFTRCVTREKQLTEKCTPAEWQARFETWRQRTPQ